MQSQCQQGPLEPSLFACWSDQTSKSPWIETQFLKNKKRKKERKKEKETMWAMSNEQCWCELIRSCRMMSKYLCTCPSRVGSHCHHWSTWCGQRPKWAHNSLKKGHQQASLVQQPWPLRPAQGTNRVPQKVRKRKPWEKKRKGGGLWVTQMSLMREERGGSRGLYRQIEY